MNPRNLSAAFTLLELVVVLAILAIVTSLAVRALDGVEDQRRYEASREIMLALQEAVLGSPEDLSPDGSRTTSGFLADMGRLPKTVGVGDLTLTELWMPGTNPAYDIRQSSIDPEVFVPTGWRGPYLRLPADAPNLLDGWGTPMSSPTDSDPPEPLSSGYARLRDNADAAITTDDQAIAVVRHLGANGTLDVADTGVDRDLAVDFRGSIEASVKATVEVVDKDGLPSLGLGTDQVCIRVFGPDPSDALQVLVLPTGGPAFVAFPTAPATQLATPAEVTGVTPGPRVVRGYLYDASGNVLIAKSAVKRVTLEPGVNFVALTIRRPEAVVLP